MKTDLTTLTLDELKQIARDTGYACDDWISSEYKNPVGRGTLEFEITYDDEDEDDGDFGRGSVFVQIRDGKLTLEF